MEVPDFMPLTLYPPFVPGYAVDVVNTMVDSKKQTTATIPLIPLRAGQAIYSFHPVLWQ